jgi:hypothetical protein
MAPLTKPRIRSLEVKGFRAYGVPSQTLNLPADITAVWGPNSKGKTSLAEAFEFLLTGRISRRELMASSQDEFADALRNAHIPESADVYVAAKIIASDGSARDIKRILTTDYAKRQDCESRLEIDGKKAAEADLAALGILLLQPPLEAPVLAQHTLSYIFSVGPQDRANYFKSLLEVIDLDDLRNDIALLAGGLAQPDDPLLTNFDACKAAPLLEKALSEIERKIPAINLLADKINDLAKVLIEHAGEAAPDTLSEKITLLQQILVDRRSKTFPVTGFDRRDLAGWNAPPEDLWTSLDNYIKERDKVSEETQQLASLFGEALRLPAISGLAGPLDCPLCGTVDSLTPARVQVIQSHVEKTKDFRKAEASAKSALNQLIASADSLRTSADPAIPQHLKVKGAQRRRTGFTIARIRALLGEGGTTVIAPWLAQIKPLARAAASMRRKAAEVKATAQTQLNDFPKEFDLPALRSGFDALAPLRGAMDQAAEAHKPRAQALIVALNQALDTQTDTAGWQSFLDIAGQSAGLRTSLLDRQARTTVEKELNAALRQIDQAKEQVLEDKFSDHSTAILARWERLRPDEPTFFSEVKPRKGARRTIDFKAGLSPNQDRSAAKMRDVIAVFSQSQLHCLGLSLFLARAEHEGTGFIVLDDPVLSSDEDYRVHFNSTVLTALLALPMQVIVLTQDHTTWKELESRYRHVGISTAQLYIESPAGGSIIENTSDELLAKINRANSLARGGHPHSRKECGVQLRDAGERFCKEVLVNNRTTKGETAAELSDYDGKMLEWLCPHVEPLLDQDPAHPGKLEVFRSTVNRACHDNSPPGTEEMKVACGDMKQLVKLYLGR